MLGTRPVAKGKYVIFCHPKVIFFKNLETTLKNSRIHTVATDGNVPFGSVTYIYKRT